MKRLVIASLVVLGIVATIATVMYRMQGRAACPPNKPIKVYADTQESIYAVAEPESSVYNLLPPTNCYATLDDGVDAWVDAIRPSRVYVTPTPLGPPEPHVSEEEKKKIIDKFDPLNRQVRDQSRVEPAPVRRAFDRQGSVVQDRLIERINDKLGMVDMK